MQEQGQAERQSSAGLDHKGFVVLEDTVMCLHLVPSLAHGIPVKCVHTVWLASPVVIGWLLCVGLIVCGWL